MTVGGEKGSEAIQPCIHYREPHPVSFGTIRPPTMSPYISVFYCVLVALASAAERPPPACPADQQFSITATCNRELTEREEFKEAPNFEKLNRSVPAHHKIGCCMQKALTKCYKEKLTGDCADSVTGLIETNQKKMASVFGGRHCDYECPDDNGSYGLRPTWPLAAASVLTLLFVFEKNA